MTTLCLNRGTLKCSISNIQIGINTSSLQTSLNSGRSISQLPSDDFTDEESWIVPVEYRRGQDIADIWNAQRDARAKIVAAYNEKRKQLQ